MPLSGESGESAWPLPQKLVILGTGGNSLEALDAIRATNRQRPGPSRFEVLGFLDDAADRQGQEVSGLPVLGRLGDAKQFRDTYFIFGVGSPSNHHMRGEILAAVGLEPDRFVSIVHPSAVVSETAMLGSGVIVLANATIGTNARIGVQVVILPNAIISHDNVVGGFTCIASGACISGAVTIGHSCYIGANASVIGGVQLGDSALVGIGSTVLHDVLPGSMVVGNPARVLRAR